MKIKHVLQLASAFGVPTSFVSIPSWFRTAPQAPVVSISNVKPSIKSSNVYDWTPSTTTTVESTTTTTTAAYPSVQTVISQIATYYQIPTCLALAMGWEESKWNVNEVGDNGTSYGIYQLHVGGELGNIPISLAYNPWINALISLGHVSNIYHGNPHQDLGSIAAQAQRPYNPVAYANAIDTYITKCNAGLPPTQW